MFKTKLVKCTNLKNRPCPGLFAIVLLMPQSFDSSPDAAAYREYSRNLESMSMHRPLWVRQAIDEEFAKINVASEKYKSHGTTSDYQFGQYTATGLIADYRGFGRQGGSVSVLDVGIGAGAFIAQNHTGRRVTLSKVLQYKITVKLQAIRMLLQLQMIRVI